MVAFIKIEDRDVRGRFFLTALLGQSILPFLKVWWAPSSYFGTDGSPSLRLWALLTVWRSSLTLGTWPPVASQRSYSLNQSSPWVNCFEKELSVSSSGFNVKETKNSLESLLVAKHFIEKTLLYFPNLSNTSVAWRMLMLVSFAWNFLSALSVYWTLHLISPKSNIIRYEANSGSVPELQVLTTLTFSGQHESQA